MDRVSWVMVMVKGLFM